MPFRWRLGPESARASGEEKTLPPPSPAGEGVRTPDAEVGRYSRTLFITPATRTIKKYITARPATAKTP
jgi:hypothetical protein